VLADPAGGYDFYGANSGSPTKTTGPLTDPGKSKKSVKISGVPGGKFDYVSGGPIYYDQATGARLLVYHAEIWGKSNKDYHSMLGMAVSTDSAGLNFKDLGTIVEPNLQKGFAEVGGGSFAIVNGYMDVYFRDWGGGGVTSELAVARAPLSDLIHNALVGQATPFTKFFNGSWSQPGRGGMSSGLEIGNPANSWSAVSYNNYTNGLVMVTSQYTADGGDLYLASSSDGINWTPRQPIALDPGEQFYPSLIGTGADPQITGQSFYVYYTDSKNGGFGRWSDAQLARRLITIDPPPPPPPPTIPPPVISPDWTTTADFRAAFQTVKPATGWSYDWDSTGKLGTMSTFTALKWSDMAQTYNTTGGATQVPGTKTHVDDFLSLADGAGNPGQKGYMPIIGYTIQASDGAGTYRIFNSTISKNDGIASPGEDGMQVLVYVNNKQIGSGHAVGMDGQLANFDTNLGALKVGDTVWVMIDPLANQVNDLFTNFDFMVEKSLTGTSSPPPSTNPPPKVGPWGSVPEPGAASLFILGLAIFSAGRARNYWRE
jgi:hypothetical protein